LKRWLIRVHNPRDGIIREIVVYSKKKKEAEERVRQKLPGVDDCNVDPAVEIGDD